MQRISARKIFANFSYLAIGRALGDAFIFGLFVVLSRKFGKESIGQYSFAMALTGFFAIFSAFGFYHFTIKEISNKIGSFSISFGQIFSSRLILSGFVLGMLIIVLPFLHFSSETKLIIFLIGLYQISSRLYDGCAAGFIAHEDMHVAALLEVAFKGFTGFAAIIVTVMGGNFPMVVGTLPIVSLSFILLAYYLLKCKYGKPKLSISFSALTAIIRKASPYALSAILMNLYLRFNVVLLGFFLGSVEAGVYNVAYRLLLIFMFIPQLAADAIFPSAARLYVDSGKYFTIFYTRVLNYVIIIGLPAAAGLYLIAPDLIRLVFGGPFGQSTPVLRLLASLLLFGSLNLVLGVFLMASDRQVIRMKSHSVAATFNFITNLILIPTMGIIGAATAALLSEALLLVFFMIGIQNTVDFPKIISRLIIGSIGTASFCSAFWLFSKPPFYLLIPASVLIYTGILTLFNETRNTEIRILINALKKTLTTMKLSL